MLFSHNPYFKSDQASADASSVSGGFMVLPQLGILRRFKDAPFLAAFVRRGGEGVLFSSVIYSQRRSPVKGDNGGSIRLHFGHCRDTVSTLADPPYTALCH